MVRHSWIISEKKTTGSVSSSESRKRSRNMDHAVAGGFVVAATLAGVIVALSCGTSGLPASVSRDVASQMVLVVVMVMMGHCYSSGSWEWTRRSMARAASDTMRSAPDSSPAIVAWRTQ